MLSYMLPRSRFLFFGRPLRPLNPNKQLLSPRLFTQNSQLLLVSGVAPRPQLPFLHPATASRLPPKLPRTQFQYQLARLITTERKLFIKDQLRKGAIYTVYGWVGLVLLALMSFGIQTEVFERRFPTPSEWTLLTRNAYRIAKSLEHPDPNGTGLTDWANAGNAYCQLILRLEDPLIDGKDVRPILQDGGEIYVAGLDKAGLDISSKSEPWKRGYYECLMSAAKAAENRDGWVRDTTRDIAFPAEVVIGPSNPRPKPVPFGAKSAPLEDNCVRAFEPVETYYMKILTTHGFTTRQRLDAALAYADWLDFKGLSSTAEDMYHWGLDIAMSALPMGTNNVVDIKTGVIDEGATYVSSNLLLASTSLAFHHARYRNLAAALPIFLSVLRARRQLRTLVADGVARPVSHDDSIFQQLLSFFRSLIVTPPYSPAPPTGDEMPTRTPLSICEEAGVMTHIGEILFASSSASTNAISQSHTPQEPQVASRVTAEQLKAQQSGLSWTRDAVDLAEATLVSGAQDDEEAREKCSECLTVGMDNWSAMVTKMLKDERARLETQPKPSGSWFWSTGAVIEDERKWERESEIVHERLDRARRLLDREADRKESKSGLLLM